MPSMEGYVLTALQALTDDAERLCDKLRRKQSHSRDDWTAHTALSMRPEVPGPGDDSWH